MRNRRASDNPTPEDQPPDDEAFELAYASWRQFFALRLDRPVPTQPEIDARLLRYRRAQESGALAEFGTALVLAAGIAQALSAVSASVAAVATGAEIIVLVLSGLLVVVLAGQAFQRVRSAFEYRALAQRIDTDTLDTERLRALFADIRDSDVRQYIQEVLAQGRLLRKAEAAIALDRGRGAEGPSDASRRAFEHRVRGRRGVSAHEIGIALGCLVVVIAASGRDVEGTILLPALYLLAASALTELPRTVLQLTVDPWQLRDGGAACRRLRFALLSDLLPPVAVFLAVVVTATALHLSA